MTAVYVISALAVAALVWLADGIRRIGAVTNGKSIEDRPGTALLLIDMQTIFWEHGPYSETAKSTAEIAVQAEINNAKEKGFPIIALRQEWSIPSTKVLARLTMKGQAVEGSAGTEIAAPFAGRADHVLVKRVQDGFETGALDPLLNEMGVGKLRIVGLDLNYCVLKTALAARNRGFEVAIIRNGTLTTGSPKGAEQKLAENGITLQ